MYHLIKGTLDRPDHQAHSGPYASKDEAERAAGRALPSMWDWTVVIEVCLEAGYPTVVQGKRVVRGKEEQ